MIFIQKREKTFDIVMYLIGGVFGTYPHAAAYIQNKISNHFQRRYIKEYDPYP